MTAARRLDVTALRVHAEGLRPVYESWLTRLVALPTVSSDPARAPVIAKAAAARR